MSGSELYQITIEIKTVAAATWTCIKDCTRSVNSLIDLLQGRFDNGVMEHSAKGRRSFSQPQKSRCACSCPDSAYMCKHLAATLYGVGARLDTSPELLFTLRDVDHLELINQAIDADNLDASLQSKTGATLAGSDLGEIFGIDLEAGEAQATPPSAFRPRAAKKPAATASKGKKPPPQRKSAAKARVAKKTVEAKGKTISRKQLAKAK